MVIILSSPLNLFINKVRESVDEHPEGVVIFNPIVVGEAAEIWSKFNVVLAELKTLPDTAAASTGWPFM